MQPQIVRQLLNDAFSSSELDTIVFDCWHKWYDDIESTSPKSKKIELLVRLCEQNGEMQNLGVEIKRRNPNQYARYERMWQSGQLG